MGIYIEAIILYILLFFSGFTYLIAGGTKLYIIPALALIWYLMFKSKKADFGALKPSKKDLVSGIIALPCLLVTGWIVSFISMKTGDTSAQLALQNPSTVLEWILLVLICISAAYLEESYFRFYLLSRRQELKLNAPLALVISTALFSVCHIYEGPWGVLNAVLCGAILGVIFLRFNSLHGIAIAHGLYNIAAFVIYAITH